MKRWLWVVAVVLTSCGGHDLATPSSTTVGSVPVPQASPPAIAMTGDPEHQLTWFLNVLNGTAEVNEDGFQLRFDDAAREHLPFEQFVGLVKQLTTGAPYTIGDLIAVDSPDPDLVASDATFVSNDGTAWTVHIAVDPVGRIADLNVGAADMPVLDSDADTLAETARAIAEFGNYRWSAASVNLDAARLEDVTCSLTEGANAEAPTPIGTAAKVLILGAVADAVESGAMAWDTELIISAEDKSVAPSVLADRPDGSPVRLGDAAKMLFEVSDNTAADLLVRAIGRIKVEQAQRRWGNSYADLNVPFMTTREVRVLKTAASEVQDEYLAADPDRRREMLVEFDEVGADEIPVDVFLDGPVHPDTISWFASPIDLCTGLARLMWAGENVDGLSELVDILTINPGFPDDRPWKRLAYADGSEPGQLTMGWIMIDEADEAYGYVGSLTQASASFETSEPTMLIAAGRDLVEPKDSSTDPTVQP